MFKFKKNKWLYLIIVLSFTLFACGRLLSPYYLTPILMYHHIDDRASEWKLSVSPEQFLKQMTYLKKHHYRVLDLEEYIKAVKSNAKIDRKTVVLTFDDGYRNNFTAALPILKKFNFPATIFIQVDGIGRDDYMSEDEIRELLRNGIKIGSHTMHHGFLPNLSPELKEMEIKLSKERLESMFNIPISVFSYPGGGFDEEARKMVIDAGYIGATATHPGWDYPNKDPYALKRIRVSRTADNPLVFWLQICGYYTYYEELRG